MILGAWVIGAIALTILFNIELKGVGVVGAFLILVLIFCCIIIISEDLSSFIEIYTYLGIK